MRDPSFRILLSKDKRDISKRGKENFFVSNKTFELVNKGSQQNARDLRRLLVLSFMLGIASDAAS